MVSVLGVGFILRKLATSVSPVTTLTKNEDGSYKLDMDTPIKKISITFKDGEEFTEERADGTKVKSTVMIEGDKLIQIQVDKDGKKSRHVREFSDKLLIVTTTADGWDGTCIRIYDRCDDDY